MHPSICCFVSAIWLATIVAAPAVSAPTPDYYTRPSIFQPCPAPDDKKPWNIKNLGPVGLGIDLTRPGFTMVISNVEKGSPAEKTGQLKKGQVIESINGQVLKDRDPREILGDLVTEAEATDGRVRLKIRGQGEVTVTIPVMGSYGKTWPLNCPKSDQIVRNLAELLAKKDKPGWGEVAFMLSTGEEKDLAVVRRWMKNLTTVGDINWDRGCNGPWICEYYLRTGDAGVLPAIKAGVEELKKTMFNGGWSARGKPAAFTYSVGSGQLHAAGVHDLLFLLMARLCGVEVDEYTLQESLKQFYRFAGHGNVAYGTGLPEGGFRDNGKTAALALVMQAATLLTPEGESSVYAKARDNCAIKSFYADNWFHSAHTGGGLGEIWHHAAMSFMREKRPVPYRSYLDTRRWMLDLSRRCDGSIGIAGLTDRYDISATERGDRNYGTFLALTYTLPRKQLQLFGAPRSKWAKSYQLPVRPWGNATDDIFLSNEPIKGSKLTPADLLNEQVPTDTSLPVMTRLNNPNVSDEELLKYLHHPDYGIREAAMRAAVNQGRYQFILPCLKSDDARLRDLGAIAINGVSKVMPDEKLTPAMFDLIGQMIENPNESWWVTQDAIKALARANKDTIAKHRDRLFDLLDHCDSLWVKTAAVTTLAMIATEPTQYQIVLPHIVKATTAFRVKQSCNAAIDAIKKALATAGPEVKNFALPLIEQAFGAIPPELVARGGATQGLLAIKAGIGSIMGTLPNGDDFLRRLPKKTSKYAQTGADSDMYFYKGFKNNPQLVGKWLLLGKTSESHPGDAQILEFAKAEKTAGKGEPKRGKKGKGAALDLRAGGNIPKTFKTGPVLFWSDDMLINIQTEEACRMQVRIVGGKQYLLVETGGFPEDSDPAFSCGFNIYIKE